MDNFRNHFLKPEIILHATLRLLQLVLALTVAGIYGNGVASANKPNGYDVTKWVWNPKAPPCALDFHEFEKARDMRRALEHVLFLLIDICRTTQWSSRLFQQSRRWFMCCRMSEDGCCGRGIFSCGKYGTFFLIPLASLPSYCLGS